MGLNVQTKKKKVCILTSVHPPFNQRIFLKEAKSLAEAGYDVTEIVPHVHDEERDGICVKAVPQPGSRLERMFVTSWKVGRAALSENADVYHFHDPELIPIALVLKLLKKRVIYDAHEALAEKILSKKWIHEWLRPFVSRAVAVFERLSARFFDHVVTADSFAARTFSGQKVTILPNYPLLEMVKKDSCKDDRCSDKTVVIYVGDLTRERGLHVMLEAMALLKSENTELHLVGTFENAQDEERARSLAYVKYHGFLPMSQVYEHLLRAHIGLVLLQPVPAYFHAGENTTKLFDYMACGLAVVASDFPNLRKIVESSGCGLCVDPCRPEEVARVISSLIGDPDTRNAYGGNGRSAAVREFNWKNESKVLVGLYREILGQNV